jgi:riboflavin kinase/FMN adenylyltransferase
MLPEREFMNKEKFIYALGFFDGVHRGHQTLVYACQTMAREAGVGTAAITFEQHPRALFSKELPPLLNTTADRCDLLRQYGIDRILTYPVTEAVMGMPWRKFLLELCREQGAAGFVCGHDFRFGHKGEGNHEKLRGFCAEFGLSCAVIPEQDLEGVRVSSTHIRGLLENGQMEQAVKFLGHPHILTGEVVSGRQLGRTIGIPTANLHLPRDVLVPKFGVYCCKAIVDGKTYLAVTNVGNRPTVGGHRVTVEPWLLDFEGDLYGKIMTLEFYAFLRPEKKFASLDELRQEIRKNAEQTREFFEK